jgi:hypothetical protein
MEVYEESNKGMRWSSKNLNLAFWLTQRVTFQCPKYVQQMSLLDWSLLMEESYTQAILRKIGCYSMWEDTHLLEIEIEGLDYLQNFLLRVVAHLVSQIHLSF